MPTSAERRAANFARFQASKSEEQLAQEAQEISTTSNRLVSHVTAAEQARTKRWFVEFLQDQHPTVDAEATYFKSPSPFPPAALLKEYARYIVGSRIGILSDKLSAKTVYHYMFLTMTLLAKATGSYPSPAVRSDVFNFVTNNLTVTEGLSTAMKPKPLAHTEDVTFIIRKLYSPEYLNTFPNMRTVLNLNLYLVLLVDLCGRGCEIARNRERPEHMCLHWGDIEFYTFQSETDSDFDIRASIKVRWSKGQTQDESEFRTIPLASLLPVHMAMEDTLRLLLTVGILDNVFGPSVSSWDDLKNLRIPANIANTGRRMPMNNEMRDVPILRRMEKHRLTNTPVTTSEMQTQIGRLGVFCGFEHRLVAYCIRRRVAHALASQTTIDNRRFLMGHKHDSDEYARAYQSKVSTINFPAMFRGVEGASVLPQSSVSLNRSEDCPQRASDTGLQEAFSNSKELFDAVKTSDRLRLELLAKYQSLSSASRSSDPLWHDFKQSEISRRSIIRTLKRRTFNKEHENHFQDLTSQLESSTSKGKEKVFDVVEDQVPKSQSTCEDGAGAFVVDDPSNIELMSIDEWEWDAALSDPNTPCDQNDTTADHTSLASIYDMERSPSTRLHGLPSKTPARAGPSRLQRSGASTYNDLLGDIAKVQGDEAAISDTLRAWFGVTHGISDFPPGQEPRSGTFTCRFDGVELSQFHHAYEHTQACARLDAVARATALLGQESPLTNPCDYQKCGHGHQLGQFVPCGESFTSQRDKGIHNRDHFRSMKKTGPDGRGKVLTCFFGTCAKNPAGGRLRRDGPDFDTEDDLLEHLWEEHGLSTLKESEPSFCSFCKQWLIKPSEWRWHAATHLDEAVQIIERAGYIGEFSGRCITPQLCPFCFHDDTLPPSQRLGQLNTVYAFRKHMAAHMKSVTKMTCPCHPATCKEARKLDAAELENHLKETHGIICGMKRARNEPDHVSPAGTGDSGEVDIDEGFEDVKKNLQGTKKKKKSTTI